MRRYSFPEFKVSTNGIECVCVNEHSQASLGDIGMLSTKLGYYLYILPIAVRQQIAHSAVQHAFFPPACHHLLYGTRAIDVGSTRYDALR